jgi:hypothetical protein
MLKNSIHGRLSPSRAARQKQRWFRRGQGWRAGIEARLSTLKHRFGMLRALYKGEIGFERHDANSAEFSGQSYRPGRFRRFGIA